jgi:hypothetical protein
MLTGVPDVKNKQNVDNKISNLLSIKTFIDTRLGNINLSHWLNEMSKEVDLEYIIQTCSGYRKYQDNGYTRNSNEQISSPFFMMKLTHIYESYLEIWHKKPKLSHLLYSLIDSFKSKEDVNSILNKTNIYAHNDLNIHDIILSFKEYKELSIINRNYIDDIEGLYVYRLKDLVEKYINRYYILEKYLFLTDINNVDFNLNTCTITIHRNYPPTDFILGSSYIPNNSAQIAETLVYKNRKFYVSDITNNDGVIEYKTDKNEILSYMEYKSIVLKELKTYNLTIKELYDKHLKDIEFLNNIEANTLDNLIDILRQTDIK